MARLSARNEFIFSCEDNRKPRWPQYYSSMRESLICMECRQIHNNFLFRGADACHPGQLKSPCPWCGKYAMEVVLAKWYNESVWYNPFSWGKGHWQIIYSGDCG